MKFLNFRSQWQGVTEGNLEKIFNLLKAMWPVAVIIDEADAFLGNRSAQGDSGTSARVFSQIASFMGDTSYRGKIVWFLLTSRPDLLPVDLKRQGRAEEHLALFYPESHDERLELVRTMAKKARVQFDGDLGEVLPADLPKMSGADLESALVRAKLRAVTDRREKVSKEDLKETFADFIPPSYPLEVELQWRWRSAPPASCSPSPTGRSPATTSPAASANSSCFSRSNDMPTRDPEVGATGQVEMVVAENDLASALDHITGDTYPAVFATTRAIALCELAAGRVLAPLLSEGELSVGVVVDVKHTAATPTGARVSATARYTGRDGKLYAFEVSVKDPAGEVMTGIHKRAVIQLARLLEGAEKRR